MIESISMSECQALEEKAGECGVVLGEMGYIYLWQPHPPDFLLNSTDIMMSYF
jgi:hypothetical protein